MRPKLKSSNLQLSSGSTVTLEATYNNYGNSSRIEAGELCQNDGNNTESKRVSVRHNFVKYNGRSKEERGEKWIAQFGPTVDNWTLSECLAH